jgi:hypothetical protein
MVDAMGFFLYNTYIETTHRKSAMAKVNKQFLIQQQMNAFKAKFKHPFTIGDVVDIEEMGANYPNEISSGCGYC